MRPGIEAKGGSTTLDPSSATHCVVSGEWAAICDDEIRSRRSLPTGCNIVSESFLTGDDEAPRQLVDLRAGHNFHLDRSPTLSHSSKKKMSFVLHSALHYQDIADRLTEGVEVHFKTNSQNSYDPNAIEVHSCHGLLGCMSIKDQGYVRSKTRGMHISSQKVDLSHPRSHQM